MRLPKPVRIVPCFGLGLGLVLLSLAVDASAEKDRETPRPIDFMGEAPALDPTGDGEASLARRASADTFVVYGGPSSTEGKFETADGVATLGEWTSVDRSQRPGGWQRTTFLAETVGTTGAGNHAMWAGSDGVAEGWPGGAGYGNDWSAILEFESPPVSDPSAGQVVVLDFAFQIDTDVDYGDGVHLYFERGGRWVYLAELWPTPQDGQGGFVAPGLLHSDVYPPSIEYLGNDYADGDRIRLRLWFDSAPSRSDEDGLFDSIGGAWVDDITVTTTDGTFTEDFEGEGPYLWKDSPIWAGDFAAVYDGVDDLDPCRENDTGVVAFVDRGQTVPNPLPDGTSSTGGVTGQWTYGPGGASVNDLGGLSGETRIDNEVWSPPIDLSLPPAYESDPEMTGFLLELDLWRHKSRSNTVTFSIHFRAADDAGNWTSWRGGFGYDSAPDWLDAKFDLTQYVPEIVTEGRRTLQVAVGALGLWVDSLGTSSTPAPYLDNVRVKRYRRSGPEIRFLQRGFQSGYPASGTLANTTSVERDALDVRVDGARWLNDNDAASVIDSIMVSVDPMTPGTTIDDVRLTWVLRRNPYFEDAIRSLPARPVDRNVVVDGDLWSGEVTATKVWPDDPGSALYFDLPDEDFLYPGDVLQYYVRAVDSAGNGATLPVDLAGFGEFGGVQRGLSAYDPAFTVRGLPTLGVQGFDGSADPTVPPRTLVFNDMGPDDEADLIAALGRAGFEPGYDVDLYTMMAPGSSGSRRLDTAVGTPSLEQLGAYDTIVFLNDAAYSFVYARQWEEASVIRDWRDLPGDRRLVWFGNRALSSSDHVQTFSVDVPGIGNLGELSETLGVWDRLDVEPEAGSGMTTSYGVEMFCPTESPTDALVASAPVVRHGFVDVGGLGVPDVAASILFDRVGSDGARDVDFLFPYATGRIRARDGGPDSATVGRLLAEALEAVGGASGSFPTSSPPGRRSLALEVSPNPFNPATVVQFELPTPGPARIVVHDARGQRVRTLIDGALVAGTHRFPWNGRDDRGRSVATGVYFVRAEAAGTSLVRKVALVK